MLDLVHSLKWLQETLFLCLVKYFFCAVVIGTSSAFQACARDANAEMEHVNKPRGFEADFICCLFIHFLSPLLICNVRLNRSPVLLAKRGDTLLVCVEVVRFILVGHFKDLVGCMPILANANEVVHIKIDGWHMHSMQEARLILARRVLVKERIRGSHAFVEFTGAQQVRFICW